MLNIGLVVDHPKRDLDGNIRVACALLEKGVCVYIIPLYYQGIDIPLLELDVILINYARPINLNLVESYFKQGIAVYVLDTEGGILSETGANSVENLANYLFKSGYSKLLSGYLFWGNFLHNAFAKKEILKKEKLHITGCPRFDFASKKLRHLLSYKKTNYILVNANFSLVNPRFVKNEKKEIEILVKGGWDRRYVNKLVRDQRLIIKNFLSAIYELALSFPSRHFLIRPHPFENKKIYDDYFLGLNNVTVDGNGSVLNVIKNSSLLLHLNCGTSVESVMLKRLPVSMEFLNTPYMAIHSALPSKISVKAKSINHLKKIINNMDGAYKKFEFDRLYKKHIYRFFHLNDGCSANRVANVLFKKQHKNKNIYKTHKILLSIKGSRSNNKIIQTFQGVVANILGSLFLSNLRAIINPSRKQKDLNMQYVKNFTYTLLPNFKAKLIIKRANHPLSKLPLSSISMKLNLPKK